MAPCCFITFYLGLWVEFSPNPSTTGTTTAFVSASVRVTQPLNLSREIYFQLQFHTANTIPQSVVATGLAKDLNENNVDVFDQNADNCKPRYCGRGPSETSFLYCQFLNVVRPVPLKVGQNINMEFKNVVQQRTSLAIAGTLVEASLGICYRHPGTDNYEFVPFFKTGFGTTTLIMPGEIQGATMTVLDNWIGATSTYRMYVPLRLGIQQRDYIEIEFPQPVQPTTFVPAQVRAEQPSMEFGLCTIAFNTTIRCTFESVSNYWAFEQKPTFLIHNIINHEHPAKRDLFHLSLKLCEREEACMDETKDLLETVGMTYGQFMSAPLFEPIDPYIGLTTSYKVTLHLRHRAHHRYHFTFYVRHREDELPPDSHVEIAGIAVESNTTGLTLSSPTSSPLRENFEMTPMNYGRWENYGTKVIGSGPTVTVGVDSDVNSIKQNETIYFFLHNIVNPTEAREERKDLDVVLFGCKGNEGLCFDDDGDIDWHFEGIIPAITPAPLKQCQGQYDTDHVVKVTNHHYFFTPYVDRNAPITFAIILPPHCEMQTPYTATITGVSPTSAPYIIDYEPLTRNVTIRYSLSVTLLKTERIHIILHNIRNPTNPQQGYNNMTFQILSPRIKTPTSMQVVEECSNGQVPSFIYPPLNFTLYERESDLIHATTTYKISTYIKEPINNGDHIDITFVNGTNFVDPTIPTPLSPSTGFTFTGPCQSVILPSLLPARRCTIATSSSLQTNGTALNFTISNIVNPEFPGSLPQKTMSIYHKNNADVIIQQTHEGILARTWYGPLGEVNYYPVDKMTGVTTDYYITAKLRHYASPGDSFFIYLPLDGYFNTSYAYTVNETLSNGGQMNTSQCKFIFGPPPFVNCTIDKVGTAMGNQAVVSFVVTNVVNPPIAYATMNSTKFALIAGNTIKDDTELAYTPTYLPGPLGNASITPRIATTSTTTTYDIKIHLRLHVNISELITITFPPRTLFDGVPVATPTGEDVALGAQYGTCRTNNTQVICPVSAVGTAFTQWRTISYAISGIINPPHPPHHGYDNVSIVISDNGPFGFIKDLTTTATTRNNTYGELGPCRLSHRLPRTAVTSTMVVQFTLRHLAVIGDHIRVNFPPGTYFHGTPVGSAIEGTELLGGQVGGCVISGPLEVDCTVLKVGFGAFDTQRVIEYELTNIIQPIHIHPQLTNLSASLLDRHGEIKDITNVMTVDPIYPGPFFSAVYEATPTYTDINAYYDVTIHIRQPAFTNDWIEFTFQEGTTFGSPTVEPTKDTLTQGGQLDMCSTDIPNRSISCRIKEAGNAFMTNATVYFRIHNINNPPHPPRPEHRQIRTTLYGPDKQWKKDESSDSICKPITYGPLSHAQVTIANPESVATTVYNIDFTLRQPIQTGDYIEIVLPEGSRNNNDITMSSTGTATMGTCSLSLWPILRCPVVSLGSGYGNGASVKFIAHNIINTGAHGVLNDTIVSVLDSQLNIRDRTYALLDAVVSTSLNSQSGYVPADVKTGATTTYTLTLVMGNKPLRVGDYVAVQFPEFTSAVNNQPIIIANNKLDQCTMNASFVKCLVLDPTPFGVGSTFTYQLDNMINSPGEVPQLNDPMTQIARMMILDSAGNIIDSIGPKAPSIEDQVLVGAQLIPTSQWAGTTTTYRIILPLRQELLVGDHVQVQFRQDTTFTVTPTASEATHHDNNTNIYGITFGVCDITPSTTTVTCPVTHITNATGPLATISWLLTDVTNPIHPPVGPLSNIKVSHLNIRRATKDRCDSSTVPSTSIGQLGPVTLTAASTLTSHTTTYSVSVKLRARLKVSYYIVIDFPFGTTFNGSPVATLTGTSASGGGSFVNPCSIDTVNVTRARCQIASLGTATTPNGEHAFGEQQVLTFDVANVINAVDVPPELLPQWFHIEDDTSAYYDETWSASTPQLYAGELGVSSIVPQILTTGTTTTYEIKTMLRQRLYPWNTIEVVFPAGTRFNGIPAATSIDPPSNVLSFDNCTTAMTSVYCRIQSIDDPSRNPLYDHRNLPNDIQIPQGYITHDHNLHFQLDNIINTLHPGYPDLTNITIRIFDHYLILRDKTDTAFAHHLTTGYMLDAMYTPLDPRAAATTHYHITFRLRHLSLSGYKFEFHFPNGTYFLAPPELTPLKTTRAKLGKFNPCIPHNETSHVVCTIKDNADAFGHYMTVDFLMSNIINRQGILPAQENLLLRHLDQYDGLIDIYEQMRTRSIITGPLAYTHFEPQDTRTGVTTTWVTTLTLRQQLLPHDKIEIYFPYLTRIIPMPTVTFPSLSGVVVNNIEYDDVPSTDTINSNSTLRLSFTVDDLGTTPQAFGEHNILTINLNGIINPRYEMPLGMKLLENRRVLIKTGPHIWTDEQVDKDDTFNATLTPIVIGTTLSVPTITLTDPCTAAQSTFKLTVTLRVGLDEGDYIEMKFPSTTNVMPHPAQVQATSTSTTATFDVCEWDDVQTLRCKVVDPGTANTAGVELVIELSNMLVPVAPARPQSTDNLFTLWDPTYKYRKDVSSMTFPSTSECTFSSLSITRADPYPAATSTNNISLTLHHFASPGDYLDITFPSGTTFVTPRPPGPAAVVIGVDRDVGGSFYDSDDGGWTLLSPNQIRLKIKSIAGIPYPQDKPGHAFIGNRLLVFGIAGVINPPVEHGDINNIESTLRNTDLTIIKDSYDQGTVSANTPFDCGTVLPALHEGSYLGWGPTVTYSSAGNGITHTLATATYTCHSSGFALNGSSERTCLNTGWSPEAPTCIDIDECSDINNNPCPSESECINTLGGYVCSPYVVTPALNFTLEPNNGQVDDNGTHLIAPTSHPGLQVTALIYIGRNTHGVNTTYFGHADPWHANPVARIISECHVQSVSNTLETDFKILTCLTSYATGTALQMTIRFCYTSAMPNTIMCVNSAFGGGKIDYPTPTLSSGTIQSLTYPLSNDALSSQIFALTNLGETIRFRGNYFSPTEQHCLVWYGPDDDPLKYVCRVLPLKSNRTHMTCMTEDHREGTQLKFRVNCGGLIVDSTDSYSYPVNPVISTVSGCPEVAEGGIGTAECPTSGLFDNGTQVQITIQGHNFNFPYLAFIDGTSCLVEGNDTTTIRCPLPIGSGLRVPVFISARAKFSVPVRTLSYAVPRITSIAPGQDSTCEQDNGNPLSLINCARDGNEEIIVTGTNFGLDRAFVFVGGKLCTDLVHDPTTPHNIVRCRTPPNSRLLRSVVIYQYAGEASEEEVMVSYKQCPPGEINTGITGCIVCPMGKHSSTVGSDICTPCPSGFIAPANNSTTCIPCPVGTYQPLPGQWQCLPCEGGTIQVGEGRTECIKCLAGQYMPNYNATECIDCPAGTFQPESKAMGCMPCYNGTYTDKPAQQSCTLCPSGYHQPDSNKTSCDPCGVGKYQEYAGQSYCVECPSGYYNPVEARDVCLACPQGKYQQEKGSTKCELCDPGRYQSEAGSTFCEYCAIGSYTNQYGQAVCTPCMRGQYETSPNKTACIDCPIGTYNTEEHMSYCLNCDPGYYADKTGRTECKPCDVGYHVSIDGAAMCVPCPVGTIQPFVGQTHCDNCTEGTYTDKLAQRECLPCSQGQINNHTGLSRCFDCVIGEYMPYTGQSRCLDCPLGRYGNSYGRQDCLPCSLGQVQNLTKWHHCFQCIPGYYQDEEGQSECKGCQPGRYTDVYNAAICKFCQVGYYNQEWNITRCYQCEPGKYQDEEDKTSCKDAPVGTYTSTYGNNIPINCPAGTYLNVTGKTVCEMCPKGEYNNGTGKTACTPCDVGRYSNVPGTVNCLFCEIGKYQGTINSTVCLDCPVGKSINITGQDVCIACDMGYYAHLPGRSICLKCEAGSFTNSTEADRCIECRPGEYQPDSGATICKYCDPGYFSSNVASPSCTACEEGKYARNPGTPQCTDCPIGQVAAGVGNSNCTVCDEGWIADSPGKGICTVCEIGSHQPEKGKGTCILCAPGTIAPTPGMSVCHNCTAGKYAEEFGLGACLDCPEGTIAKDIQASECTPCVRGKFQRERGKSECEACGPGKYTDLEGLSICGDCDAGFYQGSSDQSYCDACPLGRFAGTPGNYECDECRPGRFSSTLGRVDCEVCNPGTYQPGNGSFTPCLKCEAGRFQSQPDQSDCEDCEQGKFSGDEALACIDCPLGKYSPDNRSVVCTDCEIGKSQDEQGKSSCKDCVAGYFAGTSGKIICDPCLTGTYSNEPRSVECTSCEVAKYQDGSGKTECELCQIGRYQDATGQTACEFCKAGRYQDEEGQISCVLCAGGFYFPTTNATACIECDPGWYALGEESDQCQACGVGRFRNSSQQPDRCVDCPLGKYQDEIGKTTCKDCLKGTFNNGPAQTACTRCLPGNYQDVDGQDTCKPCPVGKYHDNTQEDMTVCYDCDPGKFASSTGLRACTNCEPGHYASDSGESSCDPCEQGKFTNDEMTIHCEECAKGYFNPNTGVRECQQCEPGTFTNTTGRDACDSCTAGKYQGKPAQSVCIDCPVGKVSASEKATECTNCGTGLFMNETGKIECIQCPIGQYQDIEGSYNCTWCEPGTFASAPETVTCEECNTGMYQDEYGQIECKPCPSGTSQPDLGQTTCVKCERGTYNAETQRPACNPCETGKFGNRESMIECQNCPTGRHNNRISQTVCQQCKPGFQALVEGATECDGCVRGRFSDVYGVPECSLCPEGTYQDNFQQTICIQCPLGKSINVRGSQICAPCGAGLYADREGLRDCLSCSAGTFAVTNQILCTNCDKGKFAGTNAGQCTTCPAMSYAANPGQGLCDKCPNNAQNTHDFTQCVCMKDFYLDKNGVCSACPTCGKCDRIGVTVYNIQPSDECYPKINTNVDDLTKSVKRFSLYVDPTKYSACLNDNMEIIDNAKFREVLLKFPTFAAHEKRFQVVQPVVGDVNAAFANCPGDKARYSRDPTNTNLHAYYVPLYQPQLGYVMYFLIDILPAEGMSNALTPQALFDLLMLDLNVTRSFDPKNPIYNTNTTNGTNTTNTTDGSGSGGSGGDGSGGGGGSGGNEPVLLGTYTSAHNLAKEDTHRQVSFSLYNNPSGPSNMVVTAIDHNYNLRIPGQYDMSSWGQRDQSMPYQDVLKFTPQSVMGPLAIVDNGASVTARLFSTFDGEAAGVYYVGETNYTRFLIDEFIECLNDACKESGCEEGYEGNLCTACADGFGRTTLFECRRCPPVVQNITLGVGVILAMIVICGFLSYRTILAGEAANTSNEYKPPFPLLMKITMTGLQVMSIAQQFEFEWPGFIGDLMSTSDSAVNVASLISVDCYIKGGTLIRPFYMQSIFFLILPVLALALALSFIGPAYKCKLNKFKLSVEEQYASSPIKHSLVRSALEKNARIWEGYYVTTVTVVLFMLHPNLVRSSFLMLACKQLGQSSEQTYLLADLSEQCYTTTHIAFILIVCLPMMVLYVFGIPLITFTYLYKNRDIIELDPSTLTPDLASLAEKKKEFGAKMAFVYQGFTPKYYYWFLAEMIRKTMLVAVSVFFIGKLHLQILMASFMVFGCLLAQLAAQPFENKLMDYMEFLSLFCSFCLFFLGNFFFVDGLSREVRVIVTVTIVADIFLFAVGVIYCFLWMLRHARTHRVADFLKAARQAKLVKQYMDTLLGPYDAKGRRQKALTRGLGLPAALVGEAPERIPVDMIGGDADFMDKLDLGDGGNTGPAGTGDGVTGTGKDGKGGQGGKDTGGMSQPQQQQRRYDPRGTSIASALVGDLRPMQYDKNYGKEMEAIDLGHEAEDAPVGAQALVPAVPRIDVSEEHLHTDRLDPRYFSRVDIAEYDPSNVMENPEIEMRRRRAEADQRKFDEEDMKYTKRTEEYTRQMAQVVYSHDYHVDDNDDGMIVPPETDHVYDGVEVNGDGDGGYGGYGGDSQGYEEQVVYEYYDEDGNRVEMPEGEGYVDSGDVQVVEEYYYEENENSRTTVGPSSNSNSRNNSNSDSLRRYR